MSIMSKKTRINLYLDEAIGEAFKRFCRSRRKSYSEILEPIIYRILSTPQSSGSSSLNAIQERIHEDAVHAFRQVYEAQRQEVIDTAITDSVDDVSDVSPQIPMPITTTSTQEVNNHGTPRTRRLSKRQISR